MCDIHTMTTVASSAELGDRIREARLAHDLSQAAVAIRLGVDRSALVRMERGDRRVTALELLHLSEVLDVPVAHFVYHSPHAITSRRSALDDDAQPAERTRYRLDASMEAHLRDAESLRAGGYLAGAPDLPSGLFDNSAAARDMAAQVRAFIGHPDGALPSLSTVCELAGLYMLSVDSDGDGSSLTPERGFGVSVIGSRAPSGRRRFTAAHELGHHILGDEYQSDVGVSASRDEREKLIDGFAAELLLPCDELEARWSSLGDSPWERLVTAAAEYRVSWTVGVRTAQSAALVSKEDASLLARRTPQLGDFLAVVGAEPDEDLSTGATGPRWRRAVLRAHADSTITRARAGEMLHGALADEDFPTPTDEPAP